MDNPRGFDTEDADFGEPAFDLEAGDDRITPEAPPSPVGQDERRMQVRAYNYWTSLLGDRNFPCIEDLDPDNLPDFGPYSVLLDFTSGIENPGVSFLGEKLAHECGTDVEISHLSDVPSRSLLSRITDHYMQIIANQAPIGFEAEFLNLQGQTVLYRGILLPFSSDDDSIDFVYGVINWKELADQQTTDRLLKQIDQALQQQSERTASQKRPSSSWTKDPIAEAADEEDADEDEDGVLDLGSFIKRSFDAGGFPQPVNNDALPQPANDGLEAEPLDLAAFAYPDEAEMGLADWLASARDLAEQAGSNEDRTRQSLYAAIGRAYDFHLVAGEHPEDYAELVADYGLTIQQRAPMTPVVKLVFGADYDKTRLTEYAAALAHAQRIGLARGELAGFLSTFPGGLKSVVSTERKLRREEAGKPAKPAENKLAKKLRQIEPLPMEAIAPAGDEFALVLIRRMSDGTVAMLGEIPEDATLIERASRSLLA